jgi:hypothetical protein
MSKDFRYNADRDKRHDPASRRYAIPFLTKIFGVEFIDNPAGLHPSGFKQPDLIAKDNSIFAELEHRTNWTEKEFNFSTIRVPVRKTWLCENHHGYYCVLSADFKRFAIRQLKGITESPLATRKFFNVDSRQMEWGQFFEIPVEQFQLYMTTHTDYETIS